MAKGEVYLCQNPECRRARPEYGYLRWQGLCDECGTLVSADPVPAASPRRSAGARTRTRVGNWHGDDGSVARLSEISASGVSRLPVGIPGVDAVLGGGLPAAGALVVSGPPGIGKSTLTLQLGAAVAGAGYEVMIFTGEEHRSAIRERWNRLGLEGAERIYLSGETDALRIQEEVLARRPRFFVVDSLKTVFHPDLQSARGSLVQQKECTEVLIRIAKETGATLLVTQHVNKDDEMAGTRELAHMYDTVLRFESAGNQVRRLLAEKNRYGATNEVAMFVMEERGLRSIDDISAWALAERVEGVFGSVVVPVLDGSRVHLVELQALAQPTRQPAPTRRFVGVDKAAAETLLAILSIHGGIDVSGMNMYFKVARDMFVDEAAGQLGIVVAAASAATRVPVPKDVALIGEVDMGGVIRSVDAVERRVAEAARYGFRRICVPVFGTADLRVPGVTLCREPHIRGVLAGLGLTPGSQRRRSRQEQ